MRLCTLYMETG